jgi:PKD repeat protein
MPRALAPALVVTLAALAGCGDDTGEADGAVTPMDAKLDDLGVLPDGGGPLRGGFTILGCATLDVTAGSPHCTGPAPLTLTFVPLISGVNTFLWTFTGGDPPSSRAINPSAYFARPGNYAVTLAAGGSAGTTTASGTVTVTAGGPGAACADDGECDAAAGLTCLCGGDIGGCPGGLSVGVCTRDCAGSVCGSGQVCVDLTRAVGAPPTGDAGSTDAAASDPWRRALCLPACAGATSCRTGLLCREVPALEPGAPAGGAYSWRSACFADVLGDDGDTCIAPTGEPDPTRCLSGRCDPLGARDVCTSDCLIAGCPSMAACATFNATPSVHQCLRRCDGSRPCSDPLLGCEPPGRSGAFGFALAGEPAGTTVCAPRRCSAASDCAPAGACVDSFCAGVR